MSLFVCELPVRFQDVDAAGIGFFARVFDYAHDTFAAYMQHVGLPLDAMLREGQWALPLVHVEADYRQPLQFGDRLSVHLLAIEAGESSLRFEYELKVGEQVRARVQMKHVVLDRAARRPVKVPAAWQQALGVRAAQ